MLSSAVHLETLNLRTDYSLDDKGLFPQIFGNDYVWLSLHTISIDGVNAHEYEIIGFLQRHERTLRNFAVSEMELISGHWTNVESFAKDSLPFARLQFSDVWDNSSDLPYIPKSSLRPEEVEVCEPSKPFEGLEGTGQGLG